MWQPGRHRKTKAEREAEAIALDERIYYIKGQMWIQPVERHLVNLGYGRVWKLAARASTPNEFVWD